MNAAQRGGESVGAAQVRSVVAELHKIVHETGLERTLAIGRLVLERFFDGSARLWRDRRRNKNNSVRRLADCPGCPLSRSALNQAIGVYAVVTALPMARDLQHVGASHIGLVLPLASGDQEQWLTRANLEHWSVRRLREELRHDRRAKGERRGRPRLSNTDRLLTRARACARRLELAVDALCQAEIEREDQTALAELVVRLSATESRLSRLSRRDSDIVVKVDVRPPTALGRVAAGG